MEDHLSRILYAFERLNRVQRAYGDNSEAAHLARNYLFYTLQKASDDQGLRRGNGKLTSVINVEEDLK